MQPRPTRFRILRSVLLLTLGLLLPLGAFAQTATGTPDAADGATTAKPRVLMTTSLGDITIELDAEKAPRSVENFLQYVRDGFYDGTIFHRVIANFMIQGGGFTPDLRQKPTRPAIANEAKNKLTNKRGSVAMARTSDPNSATAQFFINTVDNRNLDHVSDERAETWGYAVFGEVVSGMEVVDAIRNTPTGPKGPFRGDVPATDIVIQKITILE